MITQKNNSKILKNAKKTFFKQKRFKIREEINKIHFFAYYLYVVRNRLLADVVRNWSV